MQVNPGQNFGAAGAGWFRMAGFVGFCVRSPQDVQGEILKRNEESTDPHIPAYSIQDTGDGFHSTLECLTCAILCFGILRSSQCARQPVDRLDADESLLGKDRSHSARRRSLTVSCSRIWMG